LAIVATVLVIMAMSMFTVDQRQFAWFSSWVKSSGQISEPGLYFKIPMVQNVRYFDKRILTLDNNEPERFITSEKKNVLVDSYIKWRIVDPKLYYISVGGDESRAKTRLNQTVNAGLREEFGKRTVHDVVSGERDKIMERDARKGRPGCAQDRRPDRRCPSEAGRTADRSQRGGLSAHGGRAQAGGQRTAFRRLCRSGKNQVPMPTASARSSLPKPIVMPRRSRVKVMPRQPIYAQAFGQNPEFYAFYRSLEAYRGSFKSKSDVLVVEPNSEFFKYMKGSGTRETTRANDLDLLLAFALMLVLEGAHAFYRAGGLA
jgi:membrane protease subunit HflC